MLLNNTINVFICNTDLSTGYGIHWITMKKLDDILYIYDSLGSKTNFRPYDKLMFKIIKKCGFKIYLYENKSQFKSSNWCGWYAILVCKYLEKCKTIDECNKMIDYLFDNDNTATLSDEIEVINHFGLKPN